MISYQSDLVIAQKNQGITRQFKAILIFLHSIFWSDCTLQMSAIKLATIKEELDRLNRRSFSRHTSSETEETRQEVYGPLSSTLDASLRLAGVNKLSVKSVADPGPDCYAPVALSALASVLMTKELSSTIFPSRKR